MQNLRSLIYRYLVNVIFNTRSDQIIYRIVCVGVRLAG